MNATVELALSPREQLLANAIAERIISLLRPEPSRLSLVDAATLATALERPSPDTPKDGDA